MIVSVPAASRAVAVETSVPGRPVFPVNTDPSAYSTAMPSQAAMPMSVHPATLLMRSSVATAPTAGVIVPVRHMRAVTFEVPVAPVIPAGLKRMR